MVQRYAALLSPLKVRDVILRNRMYSTASTPHFLQGTEANPTEKVITHFANRAKNGAAAVTVNHFHQDNIPFPGRIIDNPPAHFNLFDINDATCQNYMCQLLDAIHFYGAKATGYLMADPGWMYPDGKVPAGPDGMPPMPPFGGPKEPACSETDRYLSAEDDGPPQADVAGITREMMDNFIRNVVQEATDLKRLGFDIISMHCCYRHSPQAAMLSPLTNHRTDEYGGSWENRTRFLREIYTALRKALPTTPLECVFSVCEPEGGYTVEDTIEFAKMTEGIIDILHLRSGEMDPQHPLGFTSTEEMPTPYLNEMGQVCQAVHALGLNMVVAASAGFQDPAWANQALEEGKADLICMARSWINNPDYGQKVYEGRGEDVVPCIRCNKCHVSNGRDMWRSVCSVNPILGLEDKIARMVDEKPQKLQKVAVVGGGVAGMEFARIAAQRGHSVTLYEATDALGGQLKHADYPSFKWPLKQFKNFMVAQMEKEGIHVLLNTPATKELLATGNYDVVALAIGSKSVAPPIPGADGANVRFAAEIYGAEAGIADTVTVVGGGEIGVETALYLCELGKQVTVLEMLPELIMDAPHAHYKNMVHNYWRAQPNFRYYCGVRVTAIEEDGVRYIDHKGEEHKTSSGTTLLAIGTKAKTDEAFALHGAAPRTIVIGDCDTAGNVQKCMRAAYAAAVTL